MYQTFDFTRARDSFAFLIKTHRIREIYLPYYLCDVMRHTAIKEGCQPIFYHIDDNFFPIQNFKETDFIIYPNYFGICDKNVNILVKKYPKLIVDNAHSYFSEPKGFACFNARHKFFESEEKSILYIKKEEAPQDYTPETPPQARIVRFCELHEIYKYRNKLKIDLNSAKSPFCYPYLAPSDNAADTLARKLTAEGKTIYRYWNNLPKSFNEYKFYRRLVPIPLSPS